MAGSEVGRDIAVMELDDPDVFSANDVMALTDDVPVEVLCRRKATVVCELVEVFGSLALFELLDIPVLAVEDVRDEAVGVEEETVEAL